METNIQEIIKIKQLPEIITALEGVSEIIKKEVNEAVAMDCTEETVKEVKNRRAELNKQFKALEDRRKAVKNSIMEKYNEFEAVYKDKVASLYNNADEQLKEKIDEVETRIKEEKEQEIIEFANEHIKDKHLEHILDYSKFRVNVTKSASIKSLKEQILAFIERVETDVKLIELEEYKDEILIEYKETLDLADAKLTVLDRHKKLEEIKQQENIVQEVKENEQAVQVVVEEITTPVVMEDVEEEEVTFTVFATIDKLKRLKEFMIREGIRYE